MVNSIDTKKFSTVDLMKSIWFFLDEDKLKYVIWNIVIFIAYFFKLIPPLIVGLIVDFFVSYKVGDSLYDFYLYCIILGFLYIFVSIVRLTSKRILGDIGASAMYRVKARGFDKLLDFSIKWHDKENTGNKVQRMVSGGNGIKNWIHLIYSDILPIAVVFIGTIFIFLFLDWKFVIFVFVYLFLFFFIEFYYNRRIAQLVDEQNKAMERSSGTYFESTNNILSIKSLGVKDSLSSNVRKYEKDVLDISFEIRKYGVKKWKFFQTLNGIGLMLFLFLIGNGVIYGTITVGFIFVFYTYFEQLRGAAQEVTKIINSIIENTSYVKRMMPIFLEDEKKFFGDKAFPVWNSIIIDNASFSYSLDEKDFMLDSLNLKIDRGSKVGIVGHSGSGKSTFVKLFMGLYAIEKGEFRIGNINYYDIEHSEITKNLSIVLQESELFNLTLKDNITVMKEVSPHLFNLAVEISQLQSVIDKLPLGLDTLIGEKGYRLSGGERQRVGIARAICKDAEILILDEATSALDSKTEKAILDGIEKNLKKKTMIMIAHRLSTLSSVDNIVVFDKGKIVEDGSFHKLKENRKSMFSKLWNLQHEKN